MSRAITNQGFVWSARSCNSLGPTHRDSKAPAVAEEYPQLRLTCMTWKRELDMCSHSLEPAVCNIPRILSLFPNLRRLDLSGCSLTVRDDSLEDLHKLQKLQQLDLRGCARVSLPGYRT